ncbi:MAG: lysophospholipid acyltransferase family protein [Rhodoferax sp.]|nr:lysophospholipid acyltransferase family protein [Rhodoferax sp.]
MFQKIAASFTLFRLGLHLLYGMVVMAWRFPRLSADQKIQRIQAWAQTLLALLAIQLVVNGKPPKQRPVLLAANHISWLDIYLLLATGPSRMVAKAEVQAWPLIGKLACGAGTLFVQRQSPRDALRVVHQMAERLVAGDLLTIFPEGTTSNGEQVLAFHANLFQAAIAADAPVQPVALIYEDSATGQPSQVASYIDQDTLLGSIWRIANAAPLRVTLNFGVPQKANGRDRRTLSQDVRAEVVGLR